MTRRGYAFLCAIALLGGISAGLAIPDLPNPAHSLQEPRP